MRSGRRTDKKSPKLLLRALGVENSIFQRPESPQIDLMLPPLPVNCKTGGQFFLLKLICCKVCGTEFYVCLRCYRGQAYCCELCRMLGYLEKRRQAQQRYRQTEKGKKAHCHSENRRRHRKESQSERNMDDNTSTPLPGMVIVYLILWCCVYRGLSEPQFLPRCRFCGCQGEVVRGFSLREYG